MTLNLTLCYRLAKNLKGIIGEFVYYGAPISISNRSQDISPIFFYVSKLKNVKKTWITYHGPALLKTGAQKSRI